MATLYRQRVLFVGGLVEDNPLTSSATTLTSAALSALPALATDQYIVLTLDPDGETGAPEVVYVTAHAAGATTATISRAKEGSGAREHLRDVYWVNAPTLGDYGGVELLHRQVLGSSAATIDFQNIPDWYSELRLVFQGRTDRAGQPTDTVGLRVNNDTGANYRSPYLKGDGASAGAGVDTASGYVPVGECPGATGTASTPGQAEATLVNYAGTTFHKTVVTMSGQTNGSVEEVRATYGRWANTAAVTRLTLVSANGANFVAGSFAALYGVGRA